MFLNQSTGIPRGTRTSLWGSRHFASFYVWESSVFFSDRKKQSVSVFPLASAFQRPGENVHLNWPCVLQHAMSSQKLHQHSRTWRKGKREKKVWELFGLFIHIFIQLQLIYYEFTHKKWWYNLSLLLWVFPIKLLNM